MSRAPITSAVIVLAAVVLQSTVFAQGAPPKGRTGEKTQAPSAPVQTLEGASLDLADVVSRKPTMLVFWATWCPSCRRETPNFKEAHRRYSSRGLNVVAVDIGVRDSVTAVRDFVKENGLPYRVLFDPHQEAVYTYRVAATPTVLLLDASGAIVHRGSSVDFDAIDALLAGKPIPKRPAQDASPGGSFTRGGSGG